MKDGKYLMGFIRPAVKAYTGSDEERHNMLPPNVSMTSVALGIQTLTENQISEALSRVEEAASELAGREVDVITLGGTPPVVLGGYGFDQKIIEKIGKVTTIPATTSQTSDVKAIKLFGAVRIVIVTPFEDLINRLLIKFMEASGFEVACLKSANAPLSEYPRMPPSLSYELSREALKEAPDAQCIYISCAAWPVSDNIERLEKETGIPVVATMQSNTWGAMRLMGVKTPMYGFGRLFREY